MKHFIAAFGSKPAIYDKSHSPQPLLNGGVGHHGRSWGVFLPRYKYQECSKFLD